MSFALVGVWVLTRCLKTSIFFSIVIIHHYCNYIPHINATRYHVKKGVKDKHRLEAQIKGDRSLVGGNQGQVNKTGEEPLCVVTWWSKDLNDVSLWFEGNVCTHDSKKSGSVKLRHWIMEDLVLDQYQSFTYVCLYIIFHRQLMLFVNE